MVVHKVTKALSDGSKVYDVVITERRPLAVASDVMIIAALDEAGAEIMIDAITSQSNALRGEDIEDAPCGWMTAEEQRNADRIDGYDRDDLGESPDY